MEGRMAKKRLLMRQLREILRLKHERGLPNRAIARACSVGVGTVSDYLRRARRAELGWPLSDELDDRELERKLFPGTTIVEQGRVLPEFAHINQELKRPGVTLQLLWL